jgi:SAM-dependent methyltransferase
MSRAVLKDFDPNITQTLFFIRRALFRKVRQYAPQLTGKMLDFGCGAKPYQPLFVNVTEYIGLDYDGAGHSHKNEQIDVFYDGKHIPFANASFDSVFSSEVFEHLFNLEEILGELHRIMKPNAKIFITCPFVWNEHEVPVDFARYTQFALGHLLEKKGFRVLLQDKSGDYLSALHQLRVQYISDHLIPSIPLLGRIKLFVTNVRPVVVLIINIWFLCWHSVLPFRKDLYLNNIVLAEKI